MGVGALALVHPSYSLESRRHMIASQPGIAIQLWTIRNEIEQDLDGSLQKLKSLGFDYVESAFFPEGISIQQAGKALKNAGLKVCSIHCEMPEGAEKDRWLELQEAYDCRTMIWHGWPNNDLYKTDDGIRRLADTYNAANEFAQDNGLRFGLHNHWWEFTPHADGKLPMDLLLQYMNKDIFLEIDTYWVKVAGLDPATIVKKYANRALFMHIKDGPALSPDDSMVSLGKGSQDFPSIIKAAGNNAEWLVIEFDKCDSDIFQALENSITYLEGILQK